MFRKLHLQMTLFCTLVTGGIFLVLASVCLFLAEDSIKTNEYTSFLQQLNSALIYLQKDDAISHQWLNQIQENGRFRIYLYDNNAPLYYQSYHISEEEDLLKEEAIYLARTKYNMDIFTVSTHQVTAHTEFDFTASSGQDYYASAGVIPRNHKHLSFLILFPMQQQVGHLRLIICLASLASVSLLFIFSWFFTKRMIVPLEHTRQQQIEFIASASHELRAPLSVMRTGLEALKKTDNPTEQQHFMDLMAEEGSRMQNLVNDMLLLANTDSGRMSMHMALCQPDALLVNVYEKYEPLAAKKQIALSISLPEELLPDCYCDSERMTQVFSVLLDNALSYTPSGGKIHLALSLQKSCLLFSFSDTGCGIPDKDKPHIFDRFYQSDHAHTDKMHFGLGLCIAKEIITAHQGRIRVEDSAGGGSCFQVTLPLPARKSVS